MNFTYQAYEDMVKLLKENNYAVCSYHNHRNYDKAVILRHDVDMDLNKAVQLAHLENRLGVTSTYFVLISSDFYNLFSSKSLLYLQEIVSLNHEIGLHFDEEKYDKSTTNVVDNTLREIELIKVGSGIEIKSVSMHRPSKQTLEANYLIKDGEIVNSYSEEFFKRFKYISDSRRCWREDILGIIKNQKFEKIQILTHPIWYNNRELTAKEILSTFINNAGVERYSTLEDNFSNLKEVMKE